jgi:ABC-type sugar transport system ATPase subunit
LKALLTIAGVSKAFPSVKALSALDLDVGAGEVLAFVGENGAGKSTLLKILCGDYRLDQGRIELDGADMRHVTPLQARELGFRLVRQEPEIVPHVSAAENIFIGEWPRTGMAGRIDFSAMDAKARALLDEIGFLEFLDPQRAGLQLSPAQKHIVEIARALKPGVKVVAFDEPTSSLTVEETERLFALIRKLKARGLGIIYVSHRLHEVMAISDRIAILRDGERVAVRDTASTTPEEVIRLMVGRDLSNGFSRAETTRPEIVLKVSGLHSIWHRNINFHIRAGEIVGFAGLVGAGRTELAKVIFGDLPKDGGTIEISGKTTAIRQPADAIAANIGFAPEDRKGEGLILVRSVLENASMAIMNRLAQWGFLRKAQVEAAVDPIIRSLEVKTPSLDHEVGKLSGGNQQKVVLARWLAAAPRLLILDEPTRAVDVGAKAEIYRLVDRLAAEGMAIMLISSEMPELLALADRIHVMEGGSLSDPVAKADATEEGILALALGKSPALRKAA